MTTFREFWARSNHFGQNGGWDESREARVFFCLVNHATFRELRNGRFSPNLVTKHSSVSRRGIRKNIFENFHVRGHLPPKSDIEIRSNRHLTQSRLQVTGCIAVLFTPRYSRRARDFPRSGQLFCTTYDCGAMGRKRCPFFGFWPIFPIQNP